MDQQKLDATKGDSTELVISMEWAGAAFEPGEEWLLIFTAKNSAEDADVDAAIQKATGAGIEVTGSTATISLVPDDTATIDEGSLVFDIQAQSSVTQKIRTVAVGSIYVMQDITRENETSVPVITTEEPLPFAVSMSYEDLTDVPATFPTLSTDISDSTAAGRAILTAADAAAQRTAMGAQATLVSGTTIKTINGASVLGSGDLSTDLTSGPVTSSGGVSTIADAALSIAKTSGLQTALDSKVASSSLGTGIATFLATPTSANLASAVTDENGSGNLLFANGTISIPSGKTATINNTITWNGTDGTTITLPSTSATMARTDTGQTFAGPNTFSGQLQLTGQAATDANSAMTRGLIESDHGGRLLDSITLRDNFICGGATSGIIGQCGWSIAGTGATYARAGYYGLLVPAATITSSLNCAVLWIYAGDHLGIQGIHSRSTTRTFRMMARIGVSAFTVSGKPSSWSFAFASNPSTASAPTRIIQANSVGIAAIDPADATWAATTAKIVGDTVAPTVANGFKYICTTAGTTAGSEPTWPTTYAGTVTDGTAVFTNAGRDGSSTFIFYVAGADPLVNITVAASTVSIPTTNAGVYYDLAIEATSTGYNFAVNSETPVAIANTSTFEGSPVFVARNDTSQSTTAAALRMRGFGFYAATRM